MLSIVEEAKALGIEYRPYRNFQIRKYDDLILTATLFLLRGCHDLETRNAVNTKLLRFFREDKCVGCDRMRKVIEQFPECWCLLDRYDGAQPAMDAIWMSMSGTDDRGLSAIGLARALTVEAEEFADIHEKVRAIPAA